MTTDRIRPESALAGLVASSRISCLGFTIIWPLLGAISIQPDLPLSFYIGLLVICLSYNAIGYIVNDIVGLEKDKYDPLRQSHPLIRGAYGKNAAIAFSVAQIPVMVAVHFNAGFPIHSLVWLGLSLGLVFFYNLYCKRSAFPPSMELLLATAAFSLTLYGSSIFGSPTQLTYLIALFAFCYLLLTNGFYNHLRDVDYELDAGSNTLAIFLGSTGTRDDRLHIPLALCWYARFSQVCLLMIACLIARSQQVSWTLMILLLIVGVFLLLLQEIQLRVKRPYWDTLARIHILTLIAPILLAMYLLLEIDSAFYIVLVYLAPMIMMDSTKKILSQGSYDGRPDAKAVLKMHK